MPNIVDKINVGGQDYELRPPAFTTDTPQENSQQAFSAGGAYNFFGTADRNEWMYKAFKDRLGEKWLKGNVPEGVNIGYASTASTSNGVFFTSDGTTVFVSFNGIDWQYTDLSLSVVSNAYYNALYGVYTINGGMYYSENGINWTATGEVYGVGVGYELCGTDELLVNAAFKHSTDGGKTWIAGSNPDSTAIGYHGMVRYANGVFIGVISTQAVTRVSRSTDGITFTIMRMDASYSQQLYARGLVNFNGSWYAYFSDSTSVKLYRSIDDGLTWTDTGYSDLKRDSQTSMQCYLFAADKFVYSPTSSSSVNISLGTINNTLASLLMIAGRSRTLYSSVLPMFYMDGLWFTFDSAGVLLSTDGVNFHYSPYLGYNNKILHSIGYKKGMLVFGEYYSSVFDFRCL